VNSDDFSRACLEAFFVELLSLNTLALGFVSILGSGEAIFL